MTDQIATDNPFTDAERDALRLLAGMLIPQSAAHGVPGADDPEIFGQILADAAEQHGLFARGLGDLDQLSRDRHDRGFAALEAADRSEVVQAFAASAFINTFVTITCQCYYRDNRALEPLSLKSPPGPQGYELEQGDWSLLDPVKSREPFWRKT